MFIPFHDNVISQFEGYDNLKEFDWVLYKKKYSTFGRLDRILKAEGKNPDEYKITKQSDTLMLFYLFEEKEIERIFNKLGYNLTRSISRNTIQYYLKRTSHGSTLSKITLASILLDTDPDFSTQLYREALLSDIEDTQGGTTEEGIHLGVMTSTVTFLTKYVTGFHEKNGHLHLNPRLPDWIKRLKFKVFFHQNLYEMEFFSWGCKINLCEKNNDKSILYINNTLVKTTLNKIITLTYNDLSQKSFYSSGRNNWKVFRNNSKRFLR
jgi:trehalose/maltose hydrolase-like predicted phosphorylase